MIATNPPPNLGSEALYLSHISAPHKMTYYLPNWPCMYGIRAGVKQPVHSFLGGKGLDIQQGASAWVGSPESIIRHMGFKWLLLPISMRCLGRSNQGYSHFSHNS